MAMNYRTKYLAIIFSLILGLSVANAQGIPNTDFTLESSTNFPKPGESITITAQSYLFNVKASTIAWTVDGVSVKRGVGEITLVVSAPALGKTKLVKAIAVTIDGQTYEASKNITSGSMDLIIETGGYVPPLFQGKLPLTYQNSFRVTAIPHMANSSGKEYDPKTLVYQWKKDSGVNLQDQSGYGKQSIDLVSDIIPRPYYLMVTASTRDGSSYSQGIAEIRPQAPSLSFYVNDPLYGPLYNQAIGNTLYIGSTKETSVVAVPWGFTKPKNSLGNLTLSWMINGVSRPELNSGNIITLRSPSDSSGISSIELSIRNQQEILQGATGGFAARFVGNSSGSQATP